MGRDWDKIVRDIHDQSQKLKKVENSGEINASKNLEPPEKREKSFNDEWNS